MEKLFKTKTPNMYRYSFSVTIKSYSLIYFGINPHNLLYISLHLINPAFTVYFRNS